MSAVAIRTLSGWEVRLGAGDAEADWLSPAEARALAAELTSAADEAERRSAEDAAQPLRERVLRRLALCPYHVTGGLAKLLGEDEAAVAETLEDLRREGRVRLYRGMPGFYSTRDEAGR